MKKFRLSLVAMLATITMVFAGGDITPVEPTVMPVEVSGWEFNGQGVVYYETTNTKANELFKQENAAANVGIQLGASNKDVVAGFGAGIELTGLGTLGLEDDLVSSNLQSADGTLEGGAVTQAYLTYTALNTTAKAGRMNIPLEYSPFAFSEDWNVFKNSFEAVTLTNTSFSDTVLVGAWINKANSNDNLGEFVDFNGDDGVYMLTVHNESIQGLDLTGTYYYGAKIVADTNNDAHIFWGDGQFTLSGFEVGVQGGVVMTDSDEDTLAFGAKIGNDFGIFDIEVAGSYVNDGEVAVHNMAGTDTPLYTQMLLNGDVISTDNYTVVGTAGLDVLGGNASVAYGYTDSETDIKDYQEVDVVYTTELGGLELFAGYIYSDSDLAYKEHTARAWARYHF